MIDWRAPLHTFLVSKTSLTVKDAGAGYKEPTGDYMTFYKLSEETMSTDTGNRTYDAINDNVKVNYDPMNQVVVQLDFRGTNSYEKSQYLFYYLNTQEAKDELEAVGLYLREVQDLTPLPKLQNASIEEGYIFNIIFGYNIGIEVIKNYTTGVILNGN